MFGLNSELHRLHSGRGVFSLRERMDIIIQILLGLDKYRRTATHTLGQLIGTELPIDLWSRSAYYTREYYMCTTDKYGVQNIDYSTGRCYNHYGVA